MKTTVYRAEYETMEEFQAACEKIEKQAGKRFLKSIAAEIEQAASELAENKQAATK